MLKVKSRAILNLNTAYPDVVARGVRFLKYCTRDISAHTSLLEAVKSFGLPYNTDIEDYLAKTTCRDVFAIICAFGNVDFWDEYVGESGGSKISSVKYDSGRVAVYYDGKVDESHVLKTFGTVIKDIEFYYFTRRAGWVYYLPYEDNESPYKKG